MNGASKLTYCDNDSSPSRPLFTVRTQRLSLIHLFSHNNVSSLLTPWEGLCLRGGVIVSGLLVR